MSTEDETLRETHPQISDEEKQKWIARAISELRSELDNTSEIDALRAQLDAARVDAERYRWLRDEGYISPSRTSYMRIGFGYHAGEIDAAIDAARTEGRDDG